MSTGIRTALDELSGTDLYRNNLFRRAGLPVTAGAAQIRRRREEARLTSRLSGSASARPSARVRDEPEAADAGLDAAVAALRDPLVRIVHETLWLWCDAAPGSCTRDDHALEHRHDEAVRAHRAAVEDPHADGNAEHKAFTEALALWSELCGSDALEGRLRRRAVEIDDPRLDDDAVAALRRELPGVLLDVNAGLAAAAARPGGDPAAAARHVALVRDAPFEDREGAAALRRATRTADRRIHDDCTTAERTARAEPAGAPVVVGTLLDDVAPDLQVVRTLLGTEDGVTRALGDLVAVTVNTSCVLYLDRGGPGEESATDTRPAVDPLQRARTLTTEPTTLENIDANIEYARQAEVRTRVQQMCDAGRVDRAADALRLWRLRTSSAATRRMLSDVIDEPRALRAVLQRAPGQGAFFIGVHIYGMRAPADGTWIRTQYLTFLGIPLVPIASYVYDATHVYGRVPLSQAARWWRRVVPIVPAWLVLGGPLSSAVGGVLAFLILVLAVVLLQLAIVAPLWVEVGRWVREEQRQPAAVGGGG